MNKNKKVGTILLIVIVFVLAGLGGFIVTKIQENDLSKLEVYNYEENPNYTKCTDMEGVEFSYPSDYTSIGDSEQPMFMDPEILGATVNLVSEDTQNLSLENYIKYSKDAVKDALSVKGEIEEEYINLNGRKAAKISYTAVQSNSDVSITQVIIIKSGKGYVLTVGCLPSDKEAMREKTDIMIKSFR